MSALVLVLLIALALIAAIAGVAIAVNAVHVARWRRAREAMPPAERVGLPVVLVHGFFGFDRLVGFDYFRGIARHLEELGYTVHVPRLPRVRGVPARAAALAAQVAALGLGRVDLIAHSMGGLDARYAIAKLGLPARTLITIGTPHRGTPLADLFVSGALRLPRRAMGALGLPFEALDYLTTSAMATFDADVRDVPGVRYACVVGTIAEGKVPIALKVAHAYIKRSAGANDGLVPASSQVWGDVLTEIEADHFAQIGWHHRFDARGLYAWLVAQLADPTRRARASA